MGDGGSVEGRDREDQRSERDAGDRGIGEGRDREDRGSERDGGDGGSGDDSFAVPDPPKRRKSRWDN